MSCLNPYLGNSFISGKASIFLNFTGSRQKWICLFLKDLYSIVKLSLVGKGIVIMEQPCSKDSKNSCIQHYAMINRLWWAKFTIWHRIELYFLCFLCHHSGKSENFRVAFLKYIHVLQIVTTLICLIYLTLKNL